MNWLFVYFKGSVHLVLQTHPQEFHQNLMNLGKERQKFETDMLTDVDKDKKKEA